MTQNPPLIGLKKRKTQELWLRWSQNVKSL